MMSQLLTDIVRSMTYSLFSLESLTFEHLVAALLLDCLDYHPFKNFSSLHTGICFDLDCVPKLVFLVSSTLTLFPLLLCVCWSL